MMQIDVNLIRIGTDAWTALLANGEVLLGSTRSPKSCCARALLKRGFDPRAELRIRAGSGIVACDQLGVMGGSPAVCGTDLEGVPAHFEN